MSVELFFAVPLLVEDVDAGVRDAIYAKASAYLKSERAKFDMLRQEEEYERRGI